MKDGNGSKVGFFDAVAGVKRIVRETGREIPYCIANNGHKAEIWENPENRGGTIGFELGNRGERERILEDAGEIFAFLENGKRMR
ncbi:MAG: hypothetical protein WBC21_02905 [Minisyncoccales bacterium]